MYISKGGRHTLIQATLSSLPTYYLSLFRAPLSIISCINKLTRNFFWEGTRGDGGMHNINWAISQQPQLSDGMGIGNFKYRNSALLAKWMWRFINEIDALWRKLIVAKYNSPNCIWPSPTSRGSSKVPWRSICQYMDLVMDRVSRRMGDGGSTSI